MGFTLSTDLWKKYASQSNIEDWFGMSEEQVAEVLREAGASQEEIDAEIVVFIEQIQDAELANF